MSIDGTSILNADIRNHSDLFQFNKTGTEADTSVETKRQRVCVVMPTYNEAKNIHKVLDLLFTKVADHNIELHALIVDDSSPDGTAKIVDTYRQHTPNVHLLVRSKKEGLGAAYTHGMQYALSKYDPDIIVEMDSDLQHNPKDVLRLVAAMGDGVHMVIGSRYVNGGQLPISWSFMRRLISRTSNKVTDIILGHHEVKDSTGGFRAIRADMLRNIDLSTLNTKGYAFQAILLDEVIQHGGQVREIPISFSPRAAGSSKMQLRDLVEGGLIVLKQRLKRIRAPRLVRRPTPAIDTKR